MTLGDIMYKYETHLHTFPVSRCAVADVEDSLRCYKNLGYDGVFITNHFIDANINIDSEAPYEEKINFYFSDYEKALNLSEEIGIKVFCGQEIADNWNHFLIYGLDKEWYLSHPEIEKMNKMDELKLMMDSGALIVQAHPFRTDSRIDTFNLFYKSVHGIEIINASWSERVNTMARLYAEHYGFLLFAGSDNHSGSKRKRFAGVCTPKPVESVSDFIEMVKNRESEVFEFEVE